MTSIANDQDRLTEGNRTVQYEWIDQIQATKYLETKPANRKVSTRTLNMLVESAQKGEFYTDVAPIHFDTEGNLKNGQHRMWMVVETGIAQRFLVIRGATQKEIDVADTGKKRSPGDVMTIAGYKYGNTLSGALTNLWLYQYGNALPGMGRNMFSADQKRGLSNHNIREYILEHPDMIKSVEYVQTTPSIRLLAAPAMLAFCHYIITKVNPVQGQEFFDAIALRKFDSDDDPAYRIWQRLERAKSERNRHYTLSATEIGALFIKAWNFWVNAERIKLLRWRIGNDMSKRDDFPIPLAGRGGIRNAN